MTQVPQPSGDATSINAADELFAELDYKVVDAFADRPFAGNPAAVLQLPHWPGGGATIGTGDTHWLQLVASEFNLSETAFVVRRERGAGDPVSSASDAGSALAPEEVSDEFDLRWFTPAVEVDLCGHATLAAAHFLWDGDLSQAPLIKFHTASGVLTARRVASESPLSNRESQPLGDRAVGPIELDFPTVLPEPCGDLRERVADALETTAITAVLKSRFDVLVELADAGAVRKLSPNFRKLAAIDARGIIATASAGTALIDGKRVDFISRFFAPASGIDEDPVTGSAHCTLGPYWSEKFNKSELLAYQASKRGGHLKVIVDFEAGRVRLQGMACVTASGVLQNTHLALAGMDSSPREAH